MGRHTWKRQPTGTRPSRLRRAKIAVGGDGRVRVPEGAEGHAVRARAVRKANSRQRPPAVQARRHHLELPLGGEDSAAARRSSRIRGPVSPSGMRAHAVADLGGDELGRRPPGWPAVRCATRCTLDATGWATAVMSMTEWARASAQTRTGSRDRVRRAGLPGVPDRRVRGSRSRLTASPGPPGPRTGVPYAHDSRAGVSEHGEAIRIFQVILHKFPGSLRSRALRLLLASAGVCQMRSTSKSSSKSIS